MHAIDSTLDPPMHDMPPAPAPALGGPWEEMYLLIFQV